MIKRRFYKIEHGDNSGSSDSSSSDDSGSDFDPEVDAKGNEIEKVEEEEEQDEEQGREDDVNTLRYTSPGSGYESEDGSNNEDENDDSVGSDQQDVKNGKVSDSVGNVARDVGRRPSEKTTGITIDPNDPIYEDISNFILKIKSVFKCRLCPRILCLNEGSLRTHLASKRHSWSRKLFSEGRLKLMLNSDEEQETHAERHARILALSQKSKDSKKKDNGRQMQNRRRKKRMRGGPNKGKLAAPAKGPAKKRRTTDR